MSRLAVVVASRRCHPTPPLAWRRLRGELQPQDELVWADARGARNGPWPGTRHVQSDGHSRGAVQAAGLCGVTCLVVALTDEDTVVYAGWRQAVLAGVDDQRPAAGGPVRLPSSGTRRTVAGRLVDYAPHAVAPYLSATQDVSGNNVAYLRSALPNVPELWKAEVDARLRQHGHPPVLAPEMQVRSEREYGWSDLSGRRVASGRVYGAARAGGPLAARLLHAAACIGLPLLRVARLAAVCRLNPRLAADLWRTLPEVVLAETCWSIGEALGALAGRGGESRAW